VIVSDFVVFEQREKRNNFDFEHKTENDKTEFSTKRLSRGLALETQKNYKSEQKRERISIHFINSLFA
jgi:hypothetical protein